MATRLSTRSFVSLLLLSTGVVFASACDQAVVKCISARGDFAAKYTLVAGTGACAALKGGVLGFQSYNPAGPDGTPNFAVSSIAIQPDAIGVLRARVEASDLSDTDPTHKLYSVGTFSTADPVNEFCEVPKFDNAAEQDLPAALEIAPDPADPKDKGSPAQAATKIKYAWSNVRIYVKAAAIGTQMSGDLVYTRDGCSATYKVVGVYPAHPCADDMGKADEKLCAPDADPGAGIAVGSGISPDFPVKCDPDLLLCVLTDGALPRLK